jgi:1,2-diacylglycerol 3-alpha-glucosyltransferase
MTKPYRVAVAASGLGHVSRGIEAWAHDLGHALLERGIDALICRAVGPAQSEQERIVGCWTRESPQARRLVRRLPRFLGWRLGLGSGYGVEQATFAWNLLGLLRREAVDLLHVQDPQLALLVQRAARLGLVRTRTILAHGTEEPLEFQRRITYLQHLAPWHLDEAKSAGVWRPTWTAIPNFIDTEQFSPAAAPQSAAANALRTELGIPPDALIVLSVSAIKRHHKRIDYVLREFAALRTARPELPAWLVIAGGWESETEELLREGARLLDDRVRFLVRFPRVRMADLCRAADLFMLGSLKEMMPIALLEATASGLPCLVNRHPVMEWMIGDGGRAIEMATPGSLATALATLLSDAKLRQTLGRQAREHCLAHFGRDRVVEQILAYYGQVLARSPRRTPTPATA